MKSAVILFFLILFFFGAAFAQKPKQTKKQSSSTKTSQTPPNAAGSEKEEFEKAASEPNAAERVKALQKFVESFPDAEEKTRALELIVAARAAFGEEKLSLNEIKDGIELLKTAVRDAPTPVSDKIFTEIVLPLPTKLFWSYKQPEAAIEIARLIEEKIGDSVQQTLGLTAFYLGTENGAEAKRLAQKAVALEPKAIAAYTALGLASRMNFELEESANAYSKALELDADSISAKRSLAEMKRATGKADEAIALYREILEKTVGDSAAQAGLVLSLFDAGKGREAETELMKSLEANPNNLALLVGAAYSYAAHNDGAKAVELAQKALAVEPRYVWAHIALARGFLAQKRPLEAERALLNAKQYGNFPTLDYELAAARRQAGFFREAAEALKKSFSIKDGYVKAWIGNRVPLEAKSFIELLSIERRASIFEPLAADSPDDAEKLKALLAFAQKLEAADASETEIIVAADKFVNGDDEMKPHRQLFAAENLLRKKKALPKVLELTQAVVGKADEALNVPNASAAVMADELYESRTIAITRGEYLLVPDVPRQTLSKILRGRLEEIAGWALYEQNNTGEALIRLKRALSVLPEKSAWWRSSMWRMGAALDAEGKSAEALDAYIKSYVSANAPDAAKRIVIEALYQKVNGSIEGLEQKIGAKPTTAAATTIFVSRLQQTDSVAQVTEKKPAVEPASTTETKPDETKVETTKTEETKAEEKTPSPSPKTSPSPEELKAEPSPAPNEIKTESSPAPTTEAKTENKPETLPETNAKPDNEIKQPETVQNKNTETKDATAPKSLFDPVIITIPKPEMIKKKDSKPEEKSVENSPVNETNSKPETALVIKKDVSDEKIASGETRERKISENESENKKIEACSLVASQDAVSLLNGGGSLGILIGFQGEKGDLKQITAASSSPKDVEVALDPEIGGNAGRAFFLIKSISPNRGAYSVTFEAPCGKKEVLVKVR